MVNDLGKLVGNILIILIAWCLAAAIYTHWLKKSKIISQTVGI